MESRGRGIGDIMVEKYIDRARIAEKRVRMIELDGELVRTYKFGQQGLDHIFRDIFKALPPDACIVPWSHGEIFIQGVSASGMYKDTYCVLIASRKFDEVQERAIIPFQTITFTDRIDRLRSQKWYWRLYRWVAHIFVRRFPDHVTY